MVKSFEVIVYGMYGELEGLELYKDIKVKVR